jgi:hypothetical protein
MSWSGCAGSLSPQVMTVLALFVEFGAGFKRAEPTRAIFAMRASARRMSSCGQVRLTLMAEASALQDLQLKILGRSVLRHAGKVSRPEAEARVTLEYKTFDHRRRAGRAEVRRKALPKTARKKRAARVAD